MIALPKTTRLPCSLAGGHIAGPNADAVINILVKYSFLKGPKVHRAIVSQVVDPNGELDMPALQMAWQYFKDAGQIDGKVIVKDVIDLSYVREAVKVLGPYNKKVE
jgi:NitT/TauT family transport system substrate-binding protein